MREFFVDDDSTIKRTTIALNYRVTHILQKLITINKLDNTISSLRRLNER
jgi:hypothetical protein